MKLSFLYLLVSLPLSTTLYAQIKTAIHGDSGIDSIPASPIGWVSDFEGIFSSGEIRYLDSVIENHEKETSNEIAIVTLDLDSSRVRTLTEFDAFSLALFNQWGVGKKEKNNGLVILISKNLRKVRIEVGFGLESRLTDTEAKAIIDSVLLPHFRKGQFFEGVLQGLDLIIKEIK